MRRAAVLVAVAVVLVGCSQNDASPQAEDTVSVSASPEPATPSAPSSPTPTQATTTAPAASPSATKSKQPQPGADAFCTYLEQTQGAQQQIEDPAQFVALVEGAAAVAPGAIAEDAALYVESVRALATTITGTAKQAAKADAWLSENEDAIAAAEANLDSYSQSTCGLPFITGEG